MMAIRQPEPRDLIHTPAEMMTGIVKWGEQIKSDPGIQFNIPAIDEKVIPMRPGNLTCIIARPGHAKTSMLVYLARSEGKNILDRGIQDKEAVIYVTWEQSMEELTAMLLADPSINYTNLAWGRFDDEELKRKAIKGVHMPVWIIGKGITNRTMRVPRMTPDVVLAAIQSMEEDFGIRPRLMLFDYLQLIPTRTAKERVQQVTEMPILLKELALEVKCPAIAAVQASREVDNRTPPIPEMNDAQWASSIEQTADKVFALWRPIMKHNHGDEIDLNGERYEVTDNLLIIKMLKQRGDRGSYKWAMYFDPALMKLAELETGGAGDSQRWPEEF